jgi:glutamate transport system permease protein
VLIVATSVVLSDTLGLRLAARGSSTFIADNSFRLAVLGFIVYTSTFVCEAIRSGINTVPPGQAEAARAIGLTFSQNLRLIVLPQALRSVIVPLASVLIALTKNTTVAASIGVAEAALLMSTMVENESNALVSVFVVFAFGFIVLTLPVGLLLGALAKKLAVKR